MISTAIDDARSDRSNFYLWMSAAFVLIAFGGFVPTYWSKIAAGSFGGAPILHIHGALFFGWTLFFFAQSAWVATGRTPDHRTWGLFGISLATAMGFTVVLAAINSIKVAEAIGMGDQARRFTVVSLSGLVFFAAVLTLAIAKRRRPEVHKRLMILAMIPLMQAAIARVFKTLVAPDAVGPPPVLVSVPPGIVVDLLVVVAMIYDQRTRGRPHPVYLWGLPVLLGVQLLNVPLGASAVWMSVARALESLVG